MLPADSCRAPSDKAFRRAARDRAIAAREALAPAERADAMRRIVAGLDAVLAGAPVRTLAFCWPFRGEPDLRDAVAAWLAGDPARRAAVPRVQDAQAPLVFVRWTPQTPMRPGAFGIPEPDAAETVQPDCVLVPLNAFDAAGYRIGYGGGYFDRTLAALVPPPLTIGVGFESGRLESIGPAPHDRPVQWLVTEAGAFPCRA